MQARGDGSEVPDRPGAEVPVVLITGPPGAGKSTVGRAVAGQLGAALIDQDTATGPLTAVVAGLVGVAALDDHRLAGPTRAARYETLTALAEDNVRAGTPVVLVAPFTLERGHLEAWEALELRLRTAGGVPKLIWLRVDASVAVARVRTRGAERDAAKPAAADPLSGVTRDAEPVVPHVAVDAAAPVDDVVRAVLAAVAR